MHGARRSIYGYPPGGRGTAQELERAGDADQAVAAHPEIAHIIEEDHTDHRLRSHRRGQQRAYYGLVPARFQVAPTPMPGGSGAVYRYAVLVELAADPPRELLHRFLAIVEATLMEQNDLYKLYRDLGSLGTAILHRMQPGYFIATARRRSGVRDLVGAQLKLVALDRELFERDDATIIDTITLA